MVIKRKRFSTRTILIILLVLAIIGAGYLIIINLPKEINFVTPDEIVNNKSGFLHQKVIVKGYYDKDANQPIIASTMSTTEERNKLNLDYSKILNATDHLRVGTMYYFTGIIVKDPNSITEDPNSPIFEVILVAEKFEAV